jgi:methanogenic corrinoid protein MtbC1
MDRALADRLTAGRRLRDRKDFIAEDAAPHIEFLAAAVEAGSVAAFEDYVGWTAGVLAARGIAVESLAESLVQLERRVLSELPAPDRDGVATFFAAGLDVCKRAAADASLAKAPPLDQTVQVFVSALLAAQRRAAVTIALDALERGTPPVDLYVELVQAALHEIGRRWERNEISVADEHMATAMAQYVLAHVYERLPIPSPTKGRMLVAGVAGELHQLGANIVADVLEAHGWDVRFLGTNVPTSSILRAIEQHRPDVLGLSLTMLTNTPQLRETVAGVRAQFRDRCPRIVAGGRAFRLTSTLWLDCRVDGVATDVRDALRLLG